MRRRSKTLAGLAVLSAAIVALCPAGLGAQAVYVEGINDTEPLDPNYTTDPMKETTFLYVPSLSYDLQRVEFYTDWGDGWFNITFREDVGGMPAGILRETMFDLSGGSEFQGGDFATPYPVVAGQRYWVGFYSENQTGSHFAASGQMVEEYADTDLDGVWDAGPITWLRPMIKFYEPGATLPLDVEIVPETLNPESEGVFTAFLRMDEGRSPWDVDVSTLVCEGAPAIRVVVAGRKLVVKFQRQDLVDVPAGTSVPFTLTGQLRDGTPFAGTDTVRVLD